jgi:hypothetical protein
MLEPAMQKGTSDIFLSWHQPPIEDDSIADRRRITRSPGAANITQMRDPRFSNANRIAEFRKKRRA